MDNMKSTINERGDHWHPDPDKDRKLGGPGANQRAREDRADAAKPKSDPKKRKSGESYMDYAKRHGYKKSTPKKKSLLGRLGLRKEAYRVLAKDKGEEGKPSQFSYKDEKDAKKFADSIKGKGGKATVTKEEIKMTKKAYNKLHKDFKSDDPKKPRTTKYNPKTGGTESHPVKFVDEAKVDTVKHGVMSSAGKEKDRNERKFGKVGWNQGGQSQLRKGVHWSKRGEKKVRGAKEVEEGVGKEIKKGFKRHKDAVEKKKIENRKAVPYAALAAQHKPEGKVIQDDWKPEIIHSKLGDAKKKADKKRESKLPPHLQGDALAKMKKAFANESVDLTEEWIDSAVEIASEYFFSEGINEEGLDQIIDEVGLEDFVDFVIDPIEELNEERSARKATAKAPSYEKVKAKVDAGDAARKKAGKGEYADTAAAKRNYGDEEAPEGKTAKKKAVAKVTVRKPKAAPKKKVATVKKVEKAVKTAKKTQPAKPTSKKGLLGRVGDAVKKGVERHNKARAAGKVPEKRVKEFAKGFKKGVSGTVKFAGKVKKAVSEESELVDEKISASGYARAKKWREDQAREKDRKNNPEFYAMQDKIRAAKAKRKDKAEKNLASNMKKEELQVDEGIGDMAIKAIEKTNPPHISKRSDMMRKIKLKQLKSYLKKQDEKKKKAASKD